MMSGTRTTRLKSLDIFRGATIALMILVDHAGLADNVYWPLDHAPWSGWTPTDMVFPFFLFAVGQSISFSLQKHRETEAASAATLYGKILRRSAILFIIGVLLNGFYRYDFGTIRFMGILQRISLCYFVVCMLALNVSMPAQIVLAAAVLVIYWATMSFVMVPGCGAGILTRECNFGSWIDRLIIPASHLYKWDSWKNVGDPEGLYGTLTASVSTLIGYWTGEWIRKSKIESKTSMDLVLAGLLAITAGKIWGWSFPINKKLWTSSYALFMGGLALLLFAACYELSEVRKKSGWMSFFETFGLNAISIFIGSEILIKVLINVHINPSSPIYDWLDNNLFASWLGPYNGPTALAALIVLFWFLLAKALQKNKLFLKIG